MSDTTLGANRPGSIALAGAEVRLFERGISLQSALGEIPVRYSFPSLLRPIIRTGDNQGPIFNSGIHVRHAPGQVDQLKPAISEMFDGRLFLSAKGQSAPAATLRLADAVPLPNGGSGFALEIDGTLAHRQLYDVKLHTDDGIEQVVGANAVYYRDDWSKFGIAHITDMHVARRIDRFRTLLRDAGLDEAANRIVNWNDRFRGFIKYANFLHDTGKLDLILATGDLYDYIYEDDDNSASGGNAEFLSHLILGEAPGPEFPDVEPLRVPIFAVPGNHDYRKHPYRLIFDINLEVHNVPIKDLKRVNNYSSYLLRHEEAKELANRLEGSSGIEVKNYSPDEAGRMVAVDLENQAYQNHLGARGSYVVELGPHRIAMLDTEWDAGILDNLGDLVRHILGQCNEDERSFVGGCPNSHGIEDREYDLTMNALKQSSPEALFIVGMHAPLFNPRAYPYYLRETQRPAQGDQPEAFVADDSETTRESVRSSHPTWFRPPNDHRTITFVKRVGVEDGFEHGVARGRGPDLLRDLAGTGGVRAADLILAGHTHLHNEFIVRPGEGGELAFYMDFYTQNPGSYYPTRYTKSWKDDDAPSTAVTYVDIVPGSSAQFQPWSGPTGLEHSKTVQIPPYGNPLNDSQNASIWWADHRPLVLQTGALGPVENSQVSFSGFRVISIENNVIKSIHFISSKRLERAGFQIPWEEAIKIETPKALPFVGRSEQYGMPAAAGDPSACVLSAGSYNIVYRDPRNSLFELWRDPNNQSGAGNLTGVAQAPPATGSPVAYVNTNIDQIIIPYRAMDGVVHSVYAIPGGTGHDDLGGVANAPKAEGNPVGFYTAETDLHHVIYRSSDGHLHALYWQGNNVVAHEDLFWTNFPPAAGDPAPYYGGGMNMIAYRGLDGEIHSIYWRGAAATGHDALSAFANMPHAGGDPVAYHCARPEGDVHQVTYRAIDGQIIELWSVGAAPVQGWSLTGAIGAPAAASDPAAYYNSESETKHVIYTSADGHVHELRWTPGGGNPDHFDLTLETGAPLAVGQPSGFFVKSSRTRHVVFRAQDGQVIEIVLSYRKAMRGGNVGGPVGGGTVVVG